jgi:hypothetical protein
MFCPKVIKEIDFEFWTEEVVLTESHIVEKMPNKESIEENIE